MSKTPVRVAGTCPDGHALERDAELDDYGRPRLTWRGPCPSQGCTHQVIARRIKKKPAAAPAADPTPPAATPPISPPARRTVRKVTSYRDAPTSRPVPRRRPARDRKPADVSTAPVPAVAPAKPPIVDGRDAGGPDLVEQPPGRRPRRRLSFGGPDVRDADGFVIPGIY